MKVKCISLWQPWASLMAANLKTVETRHWRTMVRGRIYIHAAKTREGIKSLAWPTDVAIEDALGMTTDEMFKKLPFGEIVCYGDLHGCIDAPTALQAFPKQEYFGDFSKGRFGHLYQNLTAIDPIPIRGSQGFFNAELPKSI